MDFVERWFGISPDGGSGAFEACLIVAAVAALIIAVARSKLRSMLPRSVAKLTRSKTADA